MVTIDFKDRIILYELDLDARQSLTQIGKKVGLKKDVVSYRINRMQDQGIIKNFYTVIDTFKLGYNVFRIYLQLQDVPRDIKKEIISLISLYAKPPVISARVWVISFEMSSDDFLVIFTGSLKN